MSTISLAAEHCLKHVLLAASAVMPPLIFLLFLYFGKAAPNPIGSKSCHPTPTSSEVYILGYGSLLSTVSKNTTYPNTGTNIPVNVTGFKRKWNCKGAPIGHSTTYLGVDVEPSATFNGVVFKIPDQNSLAEFDKREMFYCREEVKRSQLEFLIGRNFSKEVERDYPGDDAQFWIYTVKEEFIRWPDASYPIVQTYVDVFLTGCIEMQATYNLSGYQDDCMTTTEGWNYPWVNDRIVPRRPFLYVPKAFAIDRLINRHLPHHFAKGLVEEEIRYNYNSGLRIKGSYCGVLILFMTKYMLL